MKRCLLDSSFVIDLFNEVAANRRGPAHAWISRNSGADLWVSPVTYAEVLEGAEDSVAVREAFRSFRWQTIGRQHGDRVALNQRRSDQRMGENDAWQAPLPIVWRRWLSGMIRRHSLALANDTTTTSSGPRDGCRVAESFQLGRQFSSSTSG